jgi:hypothetical protein
MCLKLDLYVDYTQWGTHHMHLRTLFYEDHSPKTIMFVLCEHSYNNNKTYKFIVA